MKLFVSIYCEGEKCLCGKPAEHKVEEKIFDDDPEPIRHEFTAYVCHDCFRRVMGPAVDRYRV